jgi:hypothetical protein
MIFTRRRKGRKRKIEDMIYLNSVNESVNSLPYPLDILTIHCGLVSLPTGKAGLWPNS